MSFEGSVSFEDIDKTKGELRLPFFFGDHTGHFAGMTTKADADRWLSMASGLPA